MARKKSHHPHSKKQTSQETAAPFPTMFFESITTEKKIEPAQEKNQPRNERAASFARTERFIWMWSGVAIVMIVIFITWARFMSTNGILNIHTWFQKDTAIQEGQKSLQYYFEKQNKDQAALSALINQSAPQVAVPASAAATSTIGNDQINQLKEKINSIAPAVPQNSNNGASLPLSPSK